MIGRLGTGILILALAGCGDRLAGGSTDTETGAVAGIAVHLDGTTAPFARIQLERPDSLTDGLPARPGGQGQVDSSGRFLVAGLAPGRWNLEFLGPDGRRALVQEVVVHSGATDTGLRVVLHSPGRIRFLTDSDTTVPWIQGSRRLAAKIGSQWVLDSVPAGAPLTLRRGMAGASRVVSRLQLAPSQDTLLP